MRRWTTCSTGRCWRDKARFSCTCSRVGGRFLVALCGFRAHQYARWTPRHPALVINSATGRSLVLEAQNSVGLWVAPGRLRRTGWPASPDARPMANCDFSMWRFFVPLNQPAAFFGLFTRDFAGVGQPALTDLLLSILDWLEGWAPVKNDPVWGIERSLPGRASRSSWWRIRCEGRHES